VFPSPEFDDAVAAVCHGSATDAEMRALSELLRSDARARDEYLLRVELHSRLASDPDLFAQAGEVRAACGGSAIQPKGQRNTMIPIKPKASTPRGTAVTLLTLAACLALLAIGIWSIRSWQPASKTGVTSAAVAMLTRTVDADWGNAPVREGSALEPGWLRLKSGLAQVIFYSGARVVIEGPAELQLLSQNEAACPQGRLLAEVPQPALGFRLKTDHLELVDFGTEFAIDATRSRTEVHVFKGKVEVRSETAGKQLLAEGEAAVTAINSPPTRMAAKVAAFESLFAFQQRSLASAAFRYEQWQLANARLNQDPSLLVHLEFQELNNADWTLRNTAERNRSVQDATVVGCERAEGRWREKQALEFHSVSDRVRLTVPGEFEALTLSAWVCVKGLDRQFNSLFMCDGFEPGTIHWLIRNDGVLGLTVLGSKAGALQITATPPVLTLDKLGMWLHLAVVLDGKARQVVHYVNGAPVAREALKVAPPYRLGSTELGNWNAKSGPNLDAKLIRNLSGALDEFELFSRAVNDAEVHDLYVKGRPD
jgi:ferric-dicitrate binding protein FerR (iron transport regulator)